MPWTVMFQGSQHDQLVFFKGDWDGLIDKDQLRQI